MKYEKLSPALNSFIHAMPKAELHVHLEGAIQPQTVLELARRHDMLGVLPAADLDGLRRWFTFTDFPHFVQIYVAISRLLRTAADFEFIVYECGADMARQNIRYRELTVSPITHIDTQQKLSIAELLAGLEAGRQRARADFGVEMRWTFDVVRELGFRNLQAGQTYNPRAAQRTLEYALAGRKYGVVGFGLGGYEVNAPPEPYAHAFTAAKEAGLLSVPHAGETEGPASIWGAIHALGADRIGHGVRAIEDPALLQLLKERQIPLELNPTSNICLHVYRRLAEHPFPHLDRMGLLVTINSDDPPLFNTSLCQEYTALATEFGYGEADLARIARNAFRVSGAPKELKENLLMEFDAWCGNETSRATAPQPRSGGVVKT